MKQLPQEQGDTRYGVRNNSSFTKLPVRSKVIIQLIQI